MLEITRQGINLEEWERILPAISDFARFIERDVVVSNPHGYASPPERREDRFFIRFWSAPSVAQRYYLPVAYGFELEKAAGGSACFPNGEGFVINEDSGNPVAELVDNNLYILLDLPHRGGQYVGEIMGRILEEVKQIWVLPDRGRNLVAAGSEEEIRERYVSFCASSLRGEIVREEARLRKAKVEIQTAEEELRKSHQLRKALLAKLSDMFSAESSFHERFVKEFDSLCKLKDVKKVRVEEGLIRIYTNEISIRYEGNAYRIGEFMISIPVLGSGSDLPRCVNITRKKEEYDHPHIKNNGKCCFGNIEKDVRKLIAGFHFFPLAQLLIKFLREYNSGNPYTKIERWG